jgi:hypothetical protein
MPQLRRKEQMDEPIIKQLIICVNQQAIVCHNLEGKEHSDELIIKQLSTCANQQTILCHNLEGSNYVI